MKNFCLIAIFSVLLTATASGQGISVKERCRGNGNLSQKSAESPVAKAAASEYPDIYGWLRYDERNQDAYGICKFNASDTENIEVLYPFDPATQACAGAYANGKYYVYLYDPEGGFPLAFGTVNLNTGKFEQIANYQGINTLFADMTFDYSTGTMYAIGTPSGSDTSILMTVDLSDGTIETIGNLHQYFITLACNYDGQLYGVEGQNGDFYSIGKTTAEITLIGNTYEVPELYLQSMEFDHNTGTLYWAANNTRQEGFIATIDTETGESTYQGTLGNNAQVVGLYIPFEKVADGAPAAVKNLSVIPAADGSLSAALSWTNPTETYGKTSPVTISKVEIFRDDIAAGTVTDAVAGKTSTWTDNTITENGLVTYRVAAVNEAGNGESTEQTVFVGHDLPCAPTNIQIIKTDQKTLKITWNSPTKGLQGGWIDESTLKYRITRFPDNKVLATNAEGSEFTDNTIETLNNYSYEILAFTADGEGGKIRSESIAAGPSLTVPVFCNFATDDEFALWTVVDQNKDAYSWRRETTLEAAYYSYNEDGTTGGDDWLISSPISLQKGKKYLLSFKLQSYDVGYPEKMDVYIGQGNTVEAMKTRLGDYTVESNTFVSYEVLLPGLPTDGDYNLGFHCHSDPYMFILYLTDVKLEEVGSLQGTVTDAGNAPIAGCTVTVKDTQYSTSTNENGQYMLENIPEGSYSVVFDATENGYVTEEKKNVKIEGGKTTSLNATLGKYQMFSLKGNITNEAGKPVEKASVSVSGRESYNCLTDSKGNFSFTGIYSNDNNGAAIMITRYGLNPYEKTIAKTEADMDLGTIAMTDKPLAPYGLKADAGNTQVTLSWQAPLDLNEFRHDNGIEKGLIGKMDGTEKSVYGAVYRTPARLTGMMWYADKQYQTHATMNVFVFDLDEEGQPTNKILYSQYGVPNTDNAWNRFDFPQTVEAPNGFLVAISCEKGHVGLGLDDGENPDPEYPFTEQTNCYSDDYTTGTFHYTETASIRRSMMIRGIGIEKGQEELPDATTGRKYKIWRMRESQKETEAEWTLLTSEPVESLTYTDKQWNVQEQGFYRYAVKTVYNKSGQLSPATFSECLANKMLTQVTVAVKTGTPENEAKGTAVTLTNSDGNAAHTYTGTVDAEGVCLFTDVWKGSYTVEVSKPGYNTMLATGIDLGKEDSYALEYTLQEYVVDPFGLEIAETGVPGERIFTWNTVNYLFDDFESHEDFAVNTSGEIGWTYIDGDGAEALPSFDVTYPELEVPMAYMVFNPFETDPALGIIDPNIRPYSGNKFLASFASETNNDFIISPELNFNKDFTFKFYAKGYTNDYGNEEMNVGYSLTGKNKEDFIWLNGESTIPVSAGDWKEYRYTVPKEAKFITVNCVSDYQFMLMIDDMFVGIELPEGVDTDNIRKDLTFEVYLDGKKETKTSSNSHTFKNLSNGTHKAGVKAVFSSKTTPLIEMEFEVNDEESVIEKIQATKASVWPNPTSGIVKIHGSYEYAEIFSSTGGRIGKFCFGKDINIGNYPKGVYFIRITTLSGCKTEKIVLE